MADTVQIIIELKQGDELIFMESKYGIHNPPSEWMYGNGNENGDTNDVTKDQIDKKIKLVLSTINISRSDIVTNLTTMVEIAGNMCAIHRVVLSEVADVKSSRYTLVRYKEEEIVARYRTIGLDRAIDANHPLISEYANSTYIRYRAGLVPLLNTIRLIEKDIALKLECTDVRMLTVDHLNKPTNKLNTSINLNMLIESDDSEIEVSCFIPDALKIGDKANIVPQLETKINKIDSNTPSATIDLIDRLTSTCNEEIHDIIILLKLLKWESGKYNTESVNTFMSNIFINYKHSLIPDMMRFHGDTALWKLNVRNHRDEIVALRDRVKESGLMSKHFSELYFDALPFPYNSNSYHENGHREKNKRSTITDGSCIYLTSDNIPFRCYTNEGIILYHDFPSDSDLEINTAIRTECLTEVEVRQLRHFTDLILKTVSKDLSILERIRDVDNMLPVLDK